MEFVDNFCVFSKLLHMSWSYKTKQTKPKKNTYTQEGIGKLGTNLFVVAHNVGRQVVQ